MRVALAAGLVLVTVLAVRAWDAWRAPPLKPWHTEAPRELDADDIDATDWAGWLAAEDAVFKELRDTLTRKLPPEDRLASNRYFPGSPMHAARLATDWNRSQLLAPAGTPRGAVVLLHGLTDSPYSLRHIAAHYRAHGFVAVSIRLPGHGTVPAALTRVRDDDWMAATRLAVRTARLLAGETAPLHVVGYSNGGALAVRYALDALDDATLPPPTRLVLISPMLGITSFARFAGVLGWPSVFPPFAKAAWLDVLPEYNPFKYNSFPVNAARQSSRLARGVSDELLARGKAARLARFPPVLTFQSALDATVLASAVVGTLYAQLPENGSELVLFDRNHAAATRDLIRPQHADAVSALLPAPPRRFAVTVVTNAAQGSGEVAVTTPAGADSARTRPLASSYPAQMFSLSHVALPFPPHDALYGTAPSPDEDFGVHLGTLAVRGERGALIVGTETLMRASSNPFFDYLLERLDLTSDNIPASGEKGVEEHHRDEPAE